jgi:hypothetical protein
LADDLVSGASAPSSCVALSTCFPNCT